MQCNVSGHFCEIWMMKEHNLSQATFNKINNFIYKIISRMIFFITCECIILLPSLQPKWKGKSGATFKLDHTYL